MPYRIVDAAGNDVKPGEAGELLGRLKESSAAAGAAKPHPAVDAEGWFHTGDQARVDEHGILYITGRIKDMMIVGGFNVYPGEVEDVLHRAADILEVVIVAMPDERLGEIPVAGIVWRDQRDAAGQAREFNNYMLPMELGDGVPAFLLGMRETTAESFRYLRLPVDEQGGMEGFLRLREALADPQLRAQAVRRYAAIATDPAKPELAEQLAASAARAR